jgi:hypothetical protein
MYFTNVLVASVVAPLVAAHGGIPGAPKIFGLPQELKATAPTAARVLRHAAEPKRGLLETRQGGQDGRCGPSFGRASCAAGYCCSGAVSDTYGFQEMISLTSIDRDTVVPPRTIVLLRTVSSTSALPAMPTRPLEVQAPAMMLVLKRAT